MRKLFLISFSFSKGGAALAANNFFSLIQSVSTISTVKISQDEAGVFQFFKRVFSWLLTKTQADKNPTKHSLNIFSYPLVTKTIQKESDAVFHFHWFNNDTLSLWDLDKIPPYSIISLHDEWFYCGAEHYYNLEDSELDFVQGYSPRKKGVSGIHWNYLIWKVKMKKISNRKDLIFTVPSSWMYQRAASSKMLKNSKLLILPNCVDTEIFSALEENAQGYFRSQIGISSDDFVLTFGAIDGTKNPIKGNSILNEALEIVSKALNQSKKDKVKLVSFGGAKKDKQLLAGFDCISLGYLPDKIELAKVYSMSNLVVVPSLVESFGQVAAEALSCSTPVVCFDTSGLRDIVKHGQNGLYAEPFSPVSLANQLIEMIKLPKNELLGYGKKGREQIESNFSAAVVREKYLQTLEFAFALKSGIIQ